MTITTKTKQVKSGAVFRNKIMCCSRRREIVEKKIDPLACGGSSRFF